MIFANCSSRTRFNSGVNAHSAFTLIELLIVISIIAIMLAMLLPSLHSAKNLAKGLACTNNLKQSNLLLLMYANDSEGKIICGMSTSVRAPGSWATWSSHLYDTGYLSKNYKTVVCTEAEFSGSDFSTPSFIQDYESFSINFNGIYKGYSGVSQFHDFNWTGTSSAGNNRGISIYQMSKPTEYIILLDGKKSGVKQNMPKFWCSTISSAQTWAATPWTIHRKDSAVNAFFADGHGGSTSLAAIRSSCENGGWIKMEFVYAPLASW